MSTAWDFDVKICSKCTIYPSHRVTSSLIVCVLICTFATLLPANANALFICVNLCIETTTKHVMAFCCYMLHILADVEWKNNNKGTHVTLSIRTLIKNRRGVEFILLVECIVLCYGIIELPNGTSSFYVKL
jgi:hypothetical protein